MSEAPYRYTAAVADQIEQRWQRRWDEDGTFRAVNPRRSALGRHTRR